LTILTASEENLEEISIAMNAFYGEYDLWSPVRLASLKAFISRSLGDVHPNRR
jgi:hypothetical protein